MSKRCAAMAILVFIFSATSRAANDVQPLKPSVERVALFKNGLGFFTMTAELPRKAVSFSFTELPIPSHGTFWMNYPKGLSVRSLVAKMQEVNEPVASPSISQLLAENVGQKVAINPYTKDATPIVGAVVSVAAPKEQRPASPYVMETRRQPDRSWEGNATIVIKTDEGLVAMTASSVARVALLGEGAKVSATAIVKQPLIRLDLDKPASGEKIELTCLARGIFWAPSYLIDISDEKSAEFKAQAIVVNEVADLEGAHVDLVTGFPNMKFADVSSPMAMTQSMADFFNSLNAGRDQGRVRSDAIMAQAAITYNAAIRSDREQPGAEYSSAAAGAVSEDLFLYPVENVNLKKGETATFPLFNVKMPYEHVYLWKIGDFVTSDEQYRNPPPTEPKAEEVWHCCRLTNTAKMPLTTSTAEFMHGGQFVGQDICYYTAPGAETNIRINRAMAVLASQSEVEVERKRNAGSFYGYQYDLVKVKGELKAVSRMDRAVKLEITKELSGEVRETAPAAKDISTAKGLRQVNPKHELTWKVELKPNEEMTLTYNYEIYVRG